MNDVKTYIDPAEEKMAMAVEYLEEALAHIRAGKANPKILDGIKVELGNASSLDGKGPFDVVLANINRNILLADMVRYVRVMRSGSVIYMSGFYMEDVPLLKAEASRCGLSFSGSKEKDRWAVLKFRMP